LWFPAIEFRVDSRNGGSQAAMAKLGAVREGVIRAERITWTGHVRDTVLFSILAASGRPGMETDNILLQVSTWLVPLIVAIVLHEISHGWVANAFGDPTARRKGG
jgi:hypothetical protein